MAGIKNKSSDRADVCRHAEGDCGCERFAAAVSRAAFGVGTGPHPRHGIRKPAATPGIGLKGVRS